MITYLLLYPVIFNTDLFGYTYIYINGKIYIKLKNNSINPFPVGLNKKFISIFTSILN